MTVRSAVATGRLLRSGRGGASGASPGSSTAPAGGRSLPGLGRAAVRARDRRRDVGLPDEATPARVLRTVVRTPRSAKAPLVEKLVLRAGGAGFRVGLCHLGGRRLTPEGGLPTKRATAVARFALSISDAHRRLVLKDAGTP